MTDDRLKELTERAERAKAIAASLAKLKDWQPMPSDKINFWQNEKEIPGDLQVKVLAAGRNSVIKELTSELETLLGGEQQRKDGE